MSQKIKEHEQLLIESLIQFLKRLKPIINRNNYLESNEITTASREQQNQHRCDLEYIFGTEKVMQNDLTN